MKSLLIAAALLTCLPTALAEDDEVPFADFGKTFLKSRFKADDVADVPLAKLHDQYCVHGSFGVFEIAYPTWQITDKNDAEDLRDITIALLQTQQRWIDWLAKGKPESEKAKADAETLVAWVRTWKPASFSKAATSADKEIFNLLGANDVQKQAARDLTEFLTKPDGLGVAPSTGEQVHLLFAPERLDFVQMMAYSGLRDPALQPSLWVKHATQWTAFWIDWTLVLALEYPPWGEDKHFKQSVPMNKYEPTGMLEHTIQQAMLAFLWAVYGDSDALYLNQAQAMNMVIEVVGAINALEGDGGRATTGGQTQAYEKFVPGGNSSGGFLPPISAAPQNTIKTNQWHEGLGKDHFLAALRKGQKAGYKQIQHEHPMGLPQGVARDKTAHFALIGRGDAKKYPVSAPFMGEPAKANQYPPFEFIADYREFFRAYKCAFWWWVQTKGDKSGAEASAAKWADLMRALGKRAPSETLDAVVLRIYGLPLSGKDGETDSLEWLFLDWLAKGK